MAAQAIDQERTEAFAGEMVDVLNKAFLGLLLSVGHQTGLFNVLDGRPPATSEQIAAAARLNERYVREWLNGMVAGHIVEYNRSSHTYALPPEHAASLTPAAGSGNLAKFMQYIALVGEIEQDIVTCFKRGGGVPYTAVPRFQRLQAEESHDTFDEALVPTMLPLVDGLIDQLQAGVEVLDIGCGYGHAVNVLARAFPKSRVTGYDFSEEGIAAGQVEATEFGLTNAHFEVKDLATLDEPDHYTFILAHDVIHDLAQPDKVLRAIYQALRPGGVLLMVDIAASSDVADNVAHPLGPFLYAASIFHCMTVSLAQGGPGLGTVWGEQMARRMLTEAGFDHVEVKQVPGDILHNYYIARKH